jgi:hypothetical protein
VLIYSDTLKRHERLHDRDGMPPLKKRSAGDLESDSPPRVPVGSYDTSSIPLNQRTESRSERMTPTMHQIPSESTFESSLPFPDVSPSYLTSHETDLSPVAAGVFTPMSFDFNINALNQFLTSGDFDALMNHQQFGHSSEVSSTLMHLPYPRPSEAIEAAWFTNMEEKDLENETTMLRSVTYYNNNSNSVPTPPFIHSEKNEIETGNIDEAWRQKVNTKLVPEVFNIVAPLPSSEFLVSPSFELLLNV